MEVECPHCIKTMDVVTSVPGNESDIPTTGDINLCLHCHNFSVFEVDPLGSLSLRRPTTQEWDNIANDERALALQASLIANRSETPWT